MITGFVCVSGRLFLSVVEILQWESALIMVTNTIIGNVKNNKLNTCFVATGTQHNITAYTYIHNIKPVIP